MEKKEVYYPSDVGPEYLTAIPGEYPFLRGIHPRMYLEKLWTMRLFAGFGTAEETNKRFKMLLAGGQTGLSTAFDMPTLLGLDSSNPRARGAVGTGGVAIDTIADMERLFGGINQSKVSTSMTINGPASVVLAMYFELARKRGAPLRSLRGTTQSDILKEFHAQKEYIVPPDASMKLLVDQIEYCARYAPKWNPISVSGYHIREAGSSAAQELFLTIGDGYATAKACALRGMNVDTFLPVFSFFFDFHNDWILEIAKIRAARVLWARIAKEKLGARNRRSWWMRVHVQTAGMTLTREQPLNNIARVAIQALGAVLAGCQSLHTNSYDEQLQLPSKEAVKIALRTQQIIAHETGITNVVDALGGSYALEALTRQLEEEAWEYLRQIDEMGGMLEAVKRGWPKREIRQSALLLQKRFEDKKDLVVGQNVFNDESAPPATFRVSPDLQEKQIAFLEETKKRRDAEAVSRALAKVEQYARKGKNCMPAICAAVRAYATIEEVCDVLRSVYGIYHEDIEV